MFSQLASMLLLGNQTGPQSTAAPISLSIPRDHPMADEILKAASTLATSKETASRVLFRTGKLDPDKCVEEFLTVLRKLAEHEGLDLDTELTKLRAANPVSNDVVGMAQKLAKMHGLPNLL